MFAIPSLQEIRTALQSPTHPRADRLRPEVHLAGAIDWIRYAHTMTGDGGISKGYSLLRRRWAPSYAETTGYTIPTLLRASAVLDRPDLRALALSLAEYLLGTATPEGAVVHWGRSSTNPIAFDTGQVIFGWLAAYEKSGDPRFLAAAVRGGDWLASVQHPSGSWEEYQYLGVVKVIDTRVAWALLKLHQVTGADRYRLAAIANLDWAMRQQNADGWFRLCAFSANEDPYTHTLAYTAEGLLECGALLGEERYAHAGRLAADALLARQHPDGRLASTYGPGWRETSRSSCLTGNCQMARLWLRLCTESGERTYYDSARRAIEFVARTQNLETPNPNIRGAIAGSHPIYGRYERFQYPNWAAKFFIDALLALQETEGKPGV